jgi:hypothetical protein
MPRLLLAGLAVAVALLAASPSVAHATTPCAQRVISDWTRDGKIDGHYSARCLRQAYRSVPEDLGDYSSIKDDITAALVGSGTTTQNGPNNRGGRRWRLHGDERPRQHAHPQGSEEAGRERSPPRGHVQSIPDSSRSLPLPLLILGVVALAALLAAASPPLIQRLRTRFPRTRTAPHADRS